MKMNIKTKIMALTVALLFLSNVTVGTILYRVSKENLQNAVVSQMAAVTQDAASQIHGINQSQFELLKNLTALPVIQNDKASLLEKCSTLGAVASMDDRYENIAFYDLSGNTVSKDGIIRNFADREYFKEAKKGNSFISNPTFESKITNRELLFYSVPVYSLNENKIIGVMVAVCYASFIDKITKSITVGEKYHPALLDMRTGETVTKTISELKSKKGGLFKKNSSADSLDNILKGALSGQIGGGVFYDEETETQMSSAYQPVGGDCSWTVLLAAPYDYFFGGMKRIRNAVVIGLIVTIILGDIITLILVSMLIKPLQAVKTNINEIASGNADLTKRILSKSEDEVGDVVKGFNKFTEKLQGIVSSIKNADSNLQLAGEDLLASTEDTSASITQILANIESVHNQINNQAESVQGTAGAVNEIASNIESLEKMIENQTAGVTQASAAVEEMIGNIHSVNNSMDKMASSFEDLTNRAQEGSSLQQDVNIKIDQIKNQSMSLQEANAAISSIAEQTNLLAMNAAIEAAHAGEAGKGFSVVADEIRKLSETSSEQSKTIGEQLSLIQDSIGAVVTASMQSSDAFMGVADKIKETDELVRQVRAAMEEQNQGSQQISQALHSMNDSTMEVRNASLEMAAGNKQILAEVQNLQDATGVMKQSMEEMSTGARKINETGAALSEISQKMQESINMIGGEINQFKI